MAGRGPSAVAETSHTGPRPYRACSVSYRPCQGGKDKPLGGKIGRMIHPALSVKLESLHDFH